MGYCHEIILLWLLVYCPTFIGRIRGKPYFYPVRITKQNQGFIPEGKGGGTIAGVVCSFVRAAKKERVTIKPLKSLAVIFIFITLNLIMRRKSSLRLDCINGLAALRL